MCKGRLEHLLQDVEESWRNHQKSFKYSWLGCDLRLEFPGLQLAPSCYQNESPNLLQPTDRECSFVKRISVLLTSAADIFASLGVDEILLFAVPVPFVPWVVTAKLHRPSTGVQNHLPPLTERRSAVVSNFGWREMGDRLAAATCPNDFVFFCSSSSSWKGPVPQLLLVWPTSHLVPGFEPVARNWVWWSSKVVRSSQSLGRSQLHTLLSGLFDQRNGFAAATAKPLQHPWRLSVPQLHPWLTIKIRQHLSNHVPQSQRFGHQMAGLVSLPN